MPKYSRAWLVLAGVVLAALLILHTSNPFQECIASPNQAEGQQALQKDISYFAVPLAVYRDCVGAYVHDKSEGIIALFTIILGIATWQLWRATRDLVHSAERTAVRQLRAYLFMDETRAVDSIQWHGFKGNPELQETEPLEADWPIAAIKVRNYGQTPAYAVLINATLDVVEMRHANTVVVPPPRLAGGASQTNIGPGAFVRLETWMSRQLTAQDKLDIAASSKAIFLCGRIDYTDAFQQERFTTFKMRYSGQYPPHWHAPFDFAEDGNTTDEQS